MKDRWKPIDPVVVQAACDVAGILSPHDAATLLLQRDLPLPRVLPLIEVLAQARNPVLSRPLILLLNHDDEEVALQAVYALGRIGSMQATRALCKTLATAGNELLKQAAIGALWDISDRRAAYLLGRIAQDRASSQSSRCLAAEALGYLRPMRAYIVGVLERVSRDEDVAVRYSALCGLEFSDSQLAVPALELLLGDHRQLPGQPSISDRAHEALESYQSRFRTGGGLSSNGKKGRHR
jgi:HEAT repeat protein